MTAPPLHMREERQRAFDTACISNPGAVIWRGDVRSTCRIAVGRVFNLVSDDNPNHTHLIGQFRAISLVAAPEGYTAVEAIFASAEASPSGPTVYTPSMVIKSALLGDVA